MPNNNNHDGRLYRSIVDFDDEQELREALINPLLWSRDDCGNDEVLADAADILLDQDWDWTLKSYNTTENTCAPPEWEANSHPQSIEEEAKRLMNVKSFDMIGRVDDLTLKQTQDSLNTLVNMAKRLFNVPIVQINLVDLGQVYSVSETGCNGVIEFERRYTFCSHTIQFKEEVMEVLNATGDSRFCQNPHVTGDFHLRYYAGTQMISPEGYRIGSFCLVGCEPKPTPMTPEQKETLKDFGRLAVQALANRRDLAVARKSLHEVEKAAQGGAHDMDDLLTTTQYAIHKLKTQPQSGSQSQTTSALNMVKEISRYTLQRVQDEAAKAHPNAFDHMTKKILTKEGSPQPDSENEKAFNMNIEKCLSNLHSLIEPIPKPAPITFACDPSLPGRLLISGTPQILIRACLNLLLFACRRNNRQQQQPSAKIQFHVLRRNKHVVFECHSDKPMEGQETTTRMQRLFEIIARQGNAASQEGEVNDEDQSILQYFGMWPLISHVKHLCGLYGYSPTSPNDEQQCVTWFAIPLVEPASAPEPPPMMQQQQPVVHHQPPPPPVMQQQQGQPHPQQQQYQQEPQQQYRQETQQSGTPGQEIPAVKYNIHALEAVLKTLQTMIQPIVRSAREEQEQQQQQRQQQQQPFQDPPTLIEFLPSEKGFSRSNSQSTVGSANRASQPNGGENRPFGHARTNSNSTIGSRQSHLSVPRSNSTANYEYPQQNKRYRVSNGF